MRDMRKEVVRPVLLKDVLLEFV